jgi:hypothetical protein
MAGFLSGRDVTTGDNIANVINFASKTLLNNINTIIPCKVLAITIVDGLQKLDIQPIINWLDNFGNPVEPPIIYNVPVCLQIGGNAGLLIEFSIGDIVIAACAQRDISVAKKTPTQQNPATYRKFDLADAIVIGKFSYALPSVYIKITDDGVEITAPEKSLTVHAGSVVVNSDDIELGAGGAGVVTASTTINDSLGHPCTIVNPSTKVKAAL